jgi:serine/threonine protein kinase
MDPLFVRSGRITPKSDVYSFGVVLLELITRKKARTEDGEVGLVESFAQSLARGIRRVREMFDAEIAIPGDVKTVEEIAKLAGKCLQLELNKRPGMLEVAERLRKLRNAPQEGQERIARFSWGGKYKPSQESNIRNQSVRIAAPAAVAPSQERSGTIHYVGIFRFRSTASDNLLELDDLLRAPACALGIGTVGTTFKTTLHESGVELVVKRVDGVDLSKREFEKRVTMIGAIQSEHIVPLRAYFHVKNEVLLLYDNFPMSSLEKALHGTVQC